MIIRGLTKKYQSINKETVIAINNISMNINNGDFIAIIGPSGSGKTTLLNCIGGFDQPTTGQVLIDEKDIHQLDEKNLNHLRTYTIGYFFQDNNLIENLSIYDNIVLPLKLAHSSFDKQYIEDMMRELGIYELKNRYPNEISAGQRQRVALARIMAKSPQILLADEPTGALDSESAKVIMTLLKKVNEKTTIIFITHDEMLAKTYANRMIRINNGKIESDEYLNESKSFISKQKVDTNIKKTIFPWKEYIKLSLNDILHKKIRNTLSILLSMLVLLFVSFSVISTTYNQNEAYIQTITNQTNIPYVPLQKLITYTDSNDLPFEVEVGFDLDDIYMINQKYHVESIPRLSTIYEDLTPYATKNIQDSLFDQFDINGLSIIDDDIINQFDFSLIYGQSPQKNNNHIEIVITNYLFQQFLLHGFSQVPHVINTFADIDHQTIILNNQSYVIVGVIDTKLDRDYQFLKNVFQEDQLNENEYTKYHQFTYVMQHSVHKMVFTHRSYIEDVYAPSIEEQIVFQNDEHILLSHPDFSFNRIIDQIYHINEVDKVIFTTTHTYDEFMYVTISQLPNHHLLLNRIDNRTNELITLFVDLNFDEIATQFELDTGNDTKEDYMQYIITQSSNSYHPNMILEYFKSQAQEEVIPTYLNEESIVFHMYIYTQQENYEIDIPVVGVIMDTTSKYALSNDTFAKISSYADSGVTHLYLDNQLNQRKYEELLKTFGEEEIKMSYTPVDVYMNGFNRLQERLELLTEIFFYGMIVFIMFAMGLFYQTISQHVEQRMKDVGILKSLGVSNKAIYFMFIIHALTISIIAFILHGVVLLTGLYGFNHLISKSVFVELTLYSINVFAISIALLVSVVIPIFASLIPIYRLSKKEPIDIIRLSQRN